MTTRIWTRRIPISFIVLILVFSSVFHIQSGSAVTIWEDDFGDQNLDGWLVTRGVFSAEHRTLWAYGTERAVSNRAYHECNVSAGNWNFDILLRQHWRWRYHPPAIRFMVDSIDDVEWEGYVLDFYTLHRSTDSVLAVYLRVRADTWNYLSHYDFDIPANGWQSIGIQRTSNGRLTIFLNNSLIIDVVDNSLTNASYFVFDSEDCVETVFNPDTHTDSFVEAKESPMLDNIKVTGTYEIVDAKYTPGLVVIAAAIGAIALVIIGNDEIKKRKS